MTSFRSCTGHWTFPPRHFTPTSATVVEELPPTAQWGGGVLYNSSTWLYPDYSTVLQVRGLQGARALGVH